MAQTFENITKEVVNRFLQNILFIDDKAYQKENKENAFDAEKISMLFAKTGKLCTVYAPISENDICSCAFLFAKSDVVVLDWYLDLDTNKDDGDEETDAEIDEPRGFYTRTLIKGIVADAKDEKLKLVIVYTGETDLKGITDDIYNDVEEYGNFKCGDCRVYSSNVAIVICAKYNGKEQFKHLEDLKSKVVKYENLPYFVMNEFSKLVNGILPNYALSAISAIREQTSKILNVYSGETDYAYLGHRVLLKNQKDAQQLLVKVFGESISDLIASYSSEIDNWLFPWVDYIFQDAKVVKINNKEITIDGKLLKELLLDNSETYKEKIARLLHGCLTTKEAENNSTLLFSVDKTIADYSNAQFAKITHHKNIFGILPKRPMLTLGTVVLHDGKYYVCIQQRCDSVRLTEERKFLFLPLTNTNGKMHILINNDTHLNVSEFSYALKTVKFKPQKGEDCVYAINAEEQGCEKLIFESIYGEKYEWVLELKELQAQRIVAAYCSALSRVGLDESEWLRNLK